MKNLSIKLLLAGLAVLAMAGITVRADDDDVSARVQARLSSFNENLPNATGATGTFEGTLNAAGDTISWTFTWDGLTGPPSAAHIHFAPRNVNGPVFTFFCGGGGKPPCPQTTSGSIDGTTTAADILAVPAQALQAGDFAAFLEILRHHDGYANMHTAQFPGGEIRGQVRIRFREDRDKDREKHDKE